MLDVTTESQEGQTRVILSGELDIASTDELERERRVLRLRFEEDLNQYEIGRRLGVSQMQVSRIMRRALRKLLDAVQGDELDDA